MQTYRIQPNLYIRTDHSKTKLVGLCVTYHVLFEIRWFSKQNHAEVNELFAHVFFLIKRVVFLISIQQLSPHQLLCEIHYYPH
jgi:hypothetical protein